MGNQLSGHYLSENVNKCERGNFARIKNERESVFIHFRLLPFQIAFNL